MKGMNSSSGTGRSCISGENSMTPGIVDAGNDKPFAILSSSYCLCKVKELWLEFGGVMTSELSIGVIVSASEQSVTQVASESVLGRVNVFLPVETGRLSCEGGRRLLRGLFTQSSALRNAM